MEPGAYVRVSQPVDRQRSRSRESRIITIRISIPAEGGFATVVVNDTPAHSGSGDSGGGGDAPRGGDDNGDIGGGASQGSRRWRRGSLSRNVIDAVEDSAPVPALGAEMTTHIHVVEDSAPCPRTLRAHQSFPVLALGPPPPETAGTDDNSYPLSPSWLPASVPMIETQTQSAQTSPCQPP